MFTAIGWPQFLLVVVVLVAGLIYAQRRRS
jgi:hypothetical protein